MFSKLSQWMALAAIAILLLTAPAAHARAKVTGLVGGTGYVEATLEGSEPGWLYIIWAYDVQSKQLFKSPVTTTTLANVTVTCEVPVEERRYQVLIIQVKPDGVSGSTTQTPQAAPTPTPAPDGGATTTTASLLRDGIYQSLRQSAQAEIQPGYMVAEIISDTPTYPPGYVPPASGIVVLDPLSPEQVGRLTLDTDSNAIMLDQQQLVDLTAEAAKADSLNLEGNQLLPGVLLSTADAAAGGTMVVDLLPQVATSVDILRTSFGEGVYSAAAPKFSRAQLETARAVIKTFKDEAIKDYERQLEEHRQAEARRAREALVRDAFKPR